MDKLGLSLDVLLSVTSLADIYYVTKDLSTSSFHNNKKANITMRICRIAKDIGFITMGVTNFISAFQMATFSASLLIPILSVTLISWIAEH